MSSVHFSSTRQDWATPWDLFNLWNPVLGPCTLDVCALPHNAKCEHYFTPFEDGLRQPWRGVCWMNPPYGREIGLWMAKAVAEVKAGNATRVVCLLPARTDTAWWHENVIPHGSVYFLRGRVRFEGAESGAPFPSAIVVFERDEEI